MSLSESWTRCRLALRRLTGATEGQCEVAGDHPASTQPTEPGGATLPTRAPGPPEAEVLIAGAVTNLRQTADFRHVRLEMACQPGLVVRADPVVFQQVAAGLIRHAAAQAPAGRVLITLAHRGDRLQLAVLDDGAGADRLVQESDLRPLERMIALQGGTLEITAHPGAGTTVLARWPDTGRERRTTAAPAAEAPAPPTQAARREPASLG